MAFLFKAKRQHDEEEASKLLTRFKRVHERDVPPQRTDGDVNPCGNLTRTAHAHVRTLRSFDEIDVSRPKVMDMDAELHASEPISIDVLRAALPVRAAEQPAKLSA